MTDKFEFDETVFDEMELGETMPNIFNYYAFPLKNEIKSYGKVLRVEPDGTVFSYTSPDFLNVYLVIEYGQLYLKWVFSGDENGTKFYEYNMEFPYTGNFNGFSFADGKLVEEYNKYGEDSFKQQTYETFSKEMIRDDFTEMFANDFCQRLRKMYSGLKRHYDELSRMFKQEIPKDNSGVLKNEIIREKLYKYIHHNQFMFLDEYDLVMRVIKDIAQSWFEEGCSEGETSGLLFSDCFDNEQWYLVEKHLYNAFDRKTLSNIMRKCLEDVDAKILASELKNEFLEIVTLIPCKFEIKQNCSRRSCMPSSRKRFLDYLDALEKDENTTTGSITDDEEYKKCRRTLLSILQAAHLLTPREEKVIRFFYGIPENLSEKEVEEGKILNLEGVRGYAETAKEFNITQERVRQIIHKMLRVGHFGCRRPKRLRDYLDD